MIQIQTIAKRCRTSLFILAVILIILVPIIWLSPKEVIVNAWAIIVGVEQVPAVITPIIRLIGILLSLLPVGVICYIIWLIAKLLKNYQKLILFTHENVKIIRKLGFSLYGWAISNILFKTLVSLLLTLNNPPHQKLLSINISGMDIQSFIIGSIIILFSWVFIEAATIAEDNALIP